MLSSGLSSAFTRFNSVATLAAVCVARLDETALLFFSLATPRRARAGALIPRGPVTRLAKSLQRRRQLAHFQVGLN